MQVFVSSSLDLDCFSKRGPEKRAMFDSKKPFSFARNRHSIAASLEYDATRRSLTINLRNNSLVYLKNRLLNLKFNLLSSYSI